ncbi:hypothetical protein DENSPDRAFT_886224, partial [Dentipellis sp. KUC8613]
MGEMGMMSGTCAMRDGYESEPAISRLCRPLSPVVHSRTSAGPPCPLSCPHRPHAPPLPSRTRTPPICTRTTPTRPCIAVSRPRVRATASLAPPLPSLATAAFAALSPPRAATTRTHVDVTRAPAAPSGISDAAAHPNDTVSHGRGAVSLPAPLSHASPRCLRTWSCCLAPSGVICRRVLGFILIPSALSLPLHVVIIFDIAPLLTSANKGAYLDNHCIVIMSDNSSPKFNITHLNGTNYRQWSEEMAAYLRTRRLWLIVNGTSKKPSPKPDN